MFDFKGVNLTSAVGWEQILLYVILGVVLVAMLVVPIFTNRRNQKKLSNLFSGLSVGDRIKTVGGLVGTVVAINETSPVDKEIVLETGTDEVGKSIMVFDINAVYQVLSKAAQPEPAVTEIEAVTAEPEAVSAVKSDKAAAESASAPVPEFKVDAKNEIGK